MKDNFSYFMPAKIIYGQDTFNDINTYINGRKTLLITSEGFVKRGLVEKLNLLTNHIVDVISDQNTTFRT